MSRAAGILFSACALGASAFLIPPGVALASNEGALSDTTLNTKSFALQIPCSECVFSPKKEEIKDEAEDDVYWIQGGANAVVLNFTVSEDGERLALNGENIYPMRFLADSLAKTYINQVPATTTWEDIKSGSARSTPLELTGSAVVVESEEIISPEGDVMVSMKHTIFELEQQPVSVDAVAIKMLKTSAGELLIAHVETVERLPPRPNDAFGPSPEELDRFIPPFDEVLEQLEDSPFPPRPHHHKGPSREHFGMDGKCNLLCKLRNAIEAKVHGMKAGMRKGGCHGAKGKGRPPHRGQLPGHVRPHFMEHDDDARPSRHHGGRPHHMRPHGHHHHHHDHGFMHSFSSGFAAVLIPTLAGIAVGMCVSLLGLLVGRLISFLWIKFYRGGRRGYASVALDDSIAEAEDEKEVMSEKHEEALPAYEHAPAYVEAINEQK